MLQYRSSRGAIIAWRQSEAVPAATGTAKPRRGWLLYANGRWYEPRRAGGSTTPNSVAPSKGAALYTGKQPTITQPRTIAAVKGAAVIGGYSPVISQIASIAVGKGAIVYTGKQATITQPRTIAAVKGAAVYAGKVPTIGAVADYRELRRFTSPICTAVDAESAICQAVSADSPITRSVTVASHIDIESTT
jgi:hypothetical protein